VLLVGLGYWNDWMNGLYYLNDDRMYSIQVLLQHIQRNLDALKQQGQSGGNVNNANLPSTAVRMALTVMGVLPVLIVYPFMQKYFVQGIAIGAVKG
jgi:putative aldouronate transport system permease protein